MSEVVSLGKAAEKLSDYWSPHVVGSVDDSYVKVAKVKGSLTWHSHELEDELFLVLKGHLRIEMEDRAVELKEGDMFVVPKGVRHNPVAEKECHILLFERKATAHTGDVVIERTRSIAEQLKRLFDLPAAGRTRSRRSAFSNRAVAQQVTAAVGINYVERQSGIRVPRNRNNSAGSRRDDGLCRYALGYFRPVLLHYGKSGAL